MDKKIKILMVDDEAQFRETTAKILNRRGYDTTVTGSGAEAIDILKKSIHEVVILDIKMPGMDGLEALAQIKKIDPKIQVIMLTGHGGEESAKDSLKKGAFDYLTKPCDIDRLTSRIKDAYGITHKEKREEKRSREIMISIEEYTTIDPDSKIGEAIDELRRSFEGLISTSRLMQTGHRSVMVFDHQGELVGTLSILDLMQALLPAYLSAPKPSLTYGMEYSTMFWSGLFTKQTKGLAAKRIREVMSPPPPTVDADANLMETVHLMQTQQARRVAVTEQGKVIGVVREQEIFFEIARIISEG